MKFMAQFQENKRPSGFVILSGAKDLCPDRDPSLRSELALERSEGMTLLKRLRLTRKTSSLQCIAAWADASNRSATGKPNDGLKKREERPGYLTQSNSLSIR